VLTWERAKVFWGSFHYMPHLFFFVVYVVMEMLPSPKKKDRGDKDKAKGDKEKPKQGKNE
jgi:hypothetical protein